VKQLGFSEMVYPGATHTRFAHCIGTFHIGRQLVQIIGHIKGTAIEQSKANVVLAAALLHDVGHGPFSHAFEAVGKRLSLRMATHEQMSDRLIREGEIAEALGSLGSGFPNDTAAVIARSCPSNMYEAVVSSQFDADRLDYMQRDRLMTGTGHGAIDFTWLLANLEVGSIPRGVDDKPLDPVETFVLGSKAVAAAETYVLGLFQLYETVYFHKATRGVEKLFTELLLRVVGRVRDDQGDLTGLPNNHPLVNFAKDPDDNSLYLSLDDTTVWGALPLLVEGKDIIISDLAQRLRDRRLYRCFDVRTLVSQMLSTAGTDDAEALSAQLSAKVVDRLQSWLLDNPTESHKLLIDKASRNPYKELQEAEGPLNQIRIREPLQNQLVDLRTRSAVIRAIKPLELWRIYIPRDDQHMHKVVDKAVSEVASERTN